MKKSTKKGAIIGAIVASVVMGGIGAGAYFTNWFTSADKITDLTKQGEVVYTLESSIVSHVATYAVAAEDLPTTNAGNVSLPVTLDVNDEFLANTRALGYENVVTINGLGYLSSSEGSKIEDQEDGAGYLNYSEILCKSWIVSEWADATSTANTKLAAFDTVRFNLSISAKALLVSYADRAEGYASVKEISQLDSYIDISISDSKSADPYRALIVGLDGSSIPNVEVKSIQLVNKSSSFDYVSLAEF